MLEFSTKKLYIVLSIIAFSCFLSGCRDKAVITAFNGLPPSPYLFEFNESVEEKKPVAITFTAEWCPHCRRYKPVFFDVGTIYDKKVTFINIDVDSPDGQVVSKRFQVRGIPTTAFVRRDGSVYKVHVGGIEKLELVDIVNNLLKSKKRKRGEPVAPFPIEPVGEVSKIEKPEPTEEEIVNKIDSDNDKEISIEEISSYVSLQGGLEKLKKAEKDIVIESTRHALGLTK